MILCSGIPYARWSAHWLQADPSPIDAEIKRIMENPEMGEPKRGDIAGVYVRKFEVGRKLFLVAYEFDDSEIDLLAMG